MQSMQVHDQMLDKLTVPGRMVNTHRIVAHGHSLKKIDPMNEPPFFFPIWPNF